jgi:hypothetical protein
MGMPPHVIIMGIPELIIFIIDSMRSRMPSIDCPSDGIILQTMPSLVISICMRHIIGAMPGIVPPIIGIMPPIIGIMFGIMPPIIGIMFGIMPPIIGIMPPIIGIMPPIIGIMPGIIPPIMLPIIGIMPGIEPIMAPGIIIAGLVDIGCIMGLALSLRSRAAGSTFTSVAGGRRTPEGRPAQTPPARRDAFLRPSGGTSVVPESFPFEAEYLWQGAEQSSARFGS